MPLFDKTQMTTLAYAYSRNTRQMNLTARQILKDRAMSAPAYKKYHMFLSHSFSDAEIVLGIVLELEDMGYVAYVDWKEDTDLDRQNTSKETANRLRARMHSCDSLFYATSETARTSKWMPWEAGYFDGIKQKVAILPVMDVAQTINQYRGQEYLGLYPYITRDNDPISRKPTLYVHEDENRVEPYDVWVKDKKQG